MSVKEIDLVRDTTMQDIALSLRTLAGINTAEVANMEEIRAIVRTGNAARVFSIGDQINVPWKDVAAQKEYTVPLDVVHFGDVTLKDGEVVPGMFLQWHYATPFGIQFDNYEAFYYAAEELPAGTYYITVGSNWGTYCKQGETYSFTLTQAVPAGGQLSGFRGMPDKAASEWRVYSWASKTDLSPIETVTVTAGANGTSLGTLAAAGNDDLNSLHRTAYGYNRWAQSAARQWLNSDKAAGAWWTQQNDYDRAPDQLATKAGFLSGFEDDFLNVLTPVQVVTALNTVTDAAEGATETTYDKFFLPSLEQIYCKPQLAGAEGEYWEYWRRALGLTSQASYHPTIYPEYITYAIEAKSSAQSVRLRSAYRGAGNSTWGVYAGGYVSSHYACNAWRCAPACVIC